MRFNIPWTGPGSSSIGASSAVCWLFGQFLYPKLNYPIGLIESSWGGTPIEVWAPPGVFTDCAHTGKRAPTEHSVLWNSMINPIRSMTIYGALWYQGESNAGHPDQYTCLIQSMVKRWRQEFHQQSLAQTSDTFPFGYVQLAGNANGSTVVGGFPGERWAQTANYGYSPNPALPKTFMAVAMDLPDFNSPYGTVHPRYKQDVAERLVLGALNVAYGQSSVDFQGPFPSSVTEAAATHRVTIVYDSGHATLDVRHNNGFEVCCMPAGTLTCNDAHAHWVAAPIVSHQASQVVIDVSGCHALQAAGIRYEWRTSPCNYKQCALYDHVSGLPAPPYISHSLKAIQGPELVG